MIQPQDAQSLQRLLGAAEIPPDVETEYNLWLSLYHRNGHSGPLGTIGLIAMIRSLGLGVAAKEARPVATNWRSLPQNGSVRVEARFFGDWQPGVFLGFVEGGTLAVRLDDDALVRECRPDMVRLAGVQRSQPEVDLPDARAALLDSPVDSSPSVAEESASPAEEDLAELPPPREVKSRKKTAVQEESAPADPPADMEPPASDWAAVPAGTKVWVELEGDICDGVFSSQLPEGTLAVSVGDRLVTAAPDVVTRADE